MTFGFASYNQVVFIRNLKNRSGNTQVQILEKVSGKNHLVKHLGTARTPLEQTQLTQQATDYLDQTRIKKGVLSLFDTRYTKTEFECYLSTLIFHPVRETPSYEFFSYFYHHLGFTHLNDERFKDLVLARILHPTSKAATQEWLEEKLNRRYSLTDLYRNMRRAHTEKYQETLEELVFKFAIEHLTPSIAVLFFDVTTLYYESTNPDELRQPGFSKDGKPHQPQIVVTLSVTTQGFPLHLKVFSGNKFEGHTFLPCIREIVDKHQLNKLVVVADAAMLSQSNLEALETNHLTFIVGARLGNLSRDLFTRVVANVPKQDGATVRFAISPSRILVVGYSQKRAYKDKSDREKQIARANWVLANPMVIAGRYKYLKRHGKGVFSLNFEQIEKGRLLEGLKGYITNAPEFSDTEIIDKYSQLWMVERAFRMSKSDLKARPVFHTARDKIEAHLTIVFAALAIIRYVEILTSRSIAHLIKILDRVKEVVIEDPATGQRVTKYTEVNEESSGLFKLAHMKLG